MASVADPSTALHGDALDAYLDHVETIFDSDDEEARQPDQDDNDAKPAQGSALPPHDSKH